jgi:hypothetical protein
MLTKNVENIIVLHNIASAHNTWKHTTYIRYSIVMELINALPGNSPVKRIQHATIEETVFSVSAVTSRNSRQWLRDVCFLWAISVPRLYK